MLSIGRSSTYSKVPSECAIRLTVQTFWKYRVLCRQHSGDRPPWSDRGISLALLLSRRSRHHVRVPDVSARLCPSGLGARPAKWEEIHARGRFGHHFHSNSTRGMWGVALVAAGVPFWYEGAPRERRCGRPSSTVIVRFSGSHARKRWGARCTALRRLRCRCAMNALRYLGVVHGGRSGDHVRHGGRDRWCRACQ
ncbi:hypothetical protein DENSPDRAFT_696988 [Dentipellis sp. KUC8613]|nr:hypothetical protein DENSPDRAFT_696988 [Dentipellis sp. KUC8613]